MNDETSTSLAPAAPATVGWAVFETVIGPCGVSWSDDAITGTALPGQDGGKTALHLTLRHPGAERSAPPPFVASAISRIQALLAGGGDSLTDLPLDLSGLGDFSCQVYAIARSVPPGRTTTYGAIAAQVGGPGVARAVGRAMGDNPFPIIVPCHRVTGADGSIGGFSAPGGARTKHRMLMLEGTAQQERPGLFGAAELFG